MKINTFSLVFFLCSSCIFQPNSDPCFKQVADSTTRSCPVAKGKVFLNRLYPAKGILIGTSEDPFQHLTLEDWLSTLPEDLNKIVISTKDSSKEVEKIIQKYTKRMSDKETKIKNKVKHFSYHGNEFTWTQDYFKTLMDKNGKRTLFPAPHPDENIRKMTQSLTKQCKIQMEKTLEGKPVSYDDIDSGDFGGNIYPITDEVMVVGDNMSDFMLDQLKRTSSQEIVTLETSWFETGHVDELISLLPGKSTADSCPFTLAIASPTLAIQLINIDSFQREELLNFKPFFNETSDDYTNCLLRIAKEPRESFDSPLCQKLKQFNREVMQRINRNVSNLAKKLKEKHQCELKNIIEFPVLLAPIDKPKDEELIGLHRFVTPNPINNVLIEKTVYISKQYYDPFADYLEKLLQVMGLKAVFIEGTILHDAGGGLHCNAQVIRTCHKP